VHADDSAVTTARFQQRVIPETVSKAMKMEPAGFDYRHAWGLPNGPDAAPADRPLRYNKLIVIEMCCRNFDGCKLFPVLPIRDSGGF
jgi:hypothetical protein